MDIRDRTSERGLITILALLIMTALMSLSIGYIGVTQREGDMVNMLKKADQARQAALAGTRLAAGTLIKDRVDDVAASLDYDGLDEEWFNLTNNTTNGIIEPFPLDAAAGIYFHVTVLDGDARARYNVSIALSNGAAQLINGLRSFAGAEQQAIMANNYMTLLEPGRAGSIGNERISYISPFGEGTDDSININTVDPFDNMNSVDPPDILTALFTKITISAGVSVPPCASTTGVAGIAGGSFAVALVRYRRGAAGGVGTPGTATTQDDLLVSNTGSHGVVYADATYDDPHRDYGPNLKTTRVGGFTPAASAGTSRVGDYCRQAVGFNGGTSLCAASVKKAYASCVMWAKESNTSGIFFIRSKGWVLKNPTTADKVDGDKAAVYQVLHVVKRTATGYDDLYHREWWQDRQDMYGTPSIGSGDYDWNNTIYIYDKGDKIPD